jgi:L-alanine-DL-glutamate epimerase-like enolase superfamily enzyme
MRSRSGSVKFRPSTDAARRTSRVGGGLGSLAGPDSYRDYAAWCANVNIPAFKIHGPSGGKLREEVVTLRAAADGASGRSGVMTDPGNRLHTLADALALGRVCDEVGAVWWEDPMRDNSPVGHRILREKITTPLMLAEFVRGLEMKMAVALDGGTDYLRADPELDMGITGVMKTAHAAEAIGMDMEVHAAGPAQRHCVSAIRNTSYYELCLLDPDSGNPLHPDVYDCDYADEIAAVGSDGCVSVPDPPGLGVQYAWERLYSQKSDKMVLKDDS